MIRSAPLAAVAVAALFWSAAPATAQSRVAAGVLDCRSAGSTGFIVGSVRRFDCVFRPSVGRRQHYVGRITRIGIDLGFTERSRLVWTVFAPTRAVGPGQLEGGYAGISAGASIGVGLGANALVGGLNNSFALQPLSVEGQRGLNLAAGVASFDLRYAR